MTIKTKRIIVGAIMYAAIFTSWFIAFITIDAGMFIGSVLSTIVMLSCVCFEYHIFSSKWSPVIASAITLLIYFFGQGNKQYLFILPLCYIVVAWCLRFEKDTNKEK